uniref:Uncharacterized protein n=1 Tax=Picea glauca TaxID=3330 RepID=A0A101LW66_PICGL|nr:hypothetical protein ABT39_MTgene1585 [Picea glauca]
MLPINSQRSESALKHCYTQLPRKERVKWDNSVTHTKLIVTSRALDRAKSSITSLPKVGRSRTT